jgi:transitional endoplasmic reticulum ATPase
VLLYGPPGTGKTTVGRALAHRLRGKFFLVDGTFIAGSRDFYERIHQVFESAKENSPAVIFIDDADAIFEDGEERGLYRYLLTMIDGLESEGRSRVCVMMTAMNLSHLPPALVRSGRVELWLEMKLPDSEARRRLLEIHTRDLPKELTGYDHDRILSGDRGIHRRGHQAPDRRCQSFIRVRSRQRQNASERDRIRGRSRDRRAGEQGTVRQR